LVDEFVRFKIGKGLYSDRLFVFENFQHNGRFYTDRDLCPEPDSSQWLKSGLVYLKTTSKHLKYYPVCKKELKEKYKELGLSSRRVYHYWELSLSEEQLKELNVYKVYTSGVHIFKSILN
jgi:hypothetical protein